MPKFSVDDIQALAAQPEKIRNVVFASAMGLGKTSLMDCLGSECGLLSDEKIGEARFAHVRQDEREKGCTLKTSVTSMVFGEDSKYLFHLMDSPGHIEQSGEVSVAIPLADGAIVLADGSSGKLPLAASRSLREIHSSLVKPLLFVNKLDMSIFVLGKTAGDIYDDLSNIVESFEVLTESIMPGQSVSPEAGSVIFGSAAQGWAFSVPQMARIYAQKFGVDAGKLAARLWGEHYYAAKEKKWSSAPREGAQRAFTQLILEPIFQVRAAVESGHFEKLERMMASQGVKLPAGYKDGAPKTIFRRVMQRWMPAGRCVGTMIVEHVPSPPTAQQSRF
jgi:elongation factor 2